jgi:DNA-binding ferritin-like protein
MVGLRFRDPHMPFDEHVGTVLVAVDPLAERMVALGGSPLVGPWHLAADTILPESSESPPRRAAMLHRRLEASRDVIDRLPAQSWGADTTDDSGTSDLLAGILRQREMKTWFLTALLSRAR